MTPSSDVLYDLSGRSYSPGQKLASGGEGRIYLLAGQESYVIKQYHYDPKGREAHKLETLSQKINHMYEKPPMPPRELGADNHAFWTWPLQPLFDIERSFVGYLMAKLKGIKGEEFLQFSSGFSWQERP